MPSAARFAGLRNRFAGPLLLLIVVAAANYNIVFLGQTLLASGNYNPIDLGISRLHPGDAQGSFAIGNWHDLGVAWWQWEPAGEMFSKAFRAGHIPLWDPNVGGGIDAHVSVTEGQYYPPYILLLLAGDTPGLRDLYYLMEVFGAGLFCYLLLRAHGCRVISSVTMGLAYMLGGALTQTINSIEGQSVAVLPVMVWAVDRVFRVATWRTTAVGSLILAAAALSSFLPIVISGYLLVAIFVGVEFLWPFFRRSTQPARVKPIAAIVASICLIGFLLLPVRTAGRQDEVFSKWYPGSGLMHFPINRLLTLVSPAASFDVNQTFGAVASQLFKAGGEASFFYVGLVPILLAFVAFPKANPKLYKLYAAFLSAALFLLFKLLGIPPFQWIGYLPVFHDLHIIPYFGAALNFAIAGLAGLGVERLMRDRGLSMVSTGFFAAVGLFIGLVRFAQTQAINPVLAGQSLWSAVTHYGLEIARLAILAAAFLALLLMRRANLAGVTSGVLMLILVFLDLAPLASRGRFLRSDAWADPPDYVRFLQNDRGVFRIHSVGDLSLPPDTSQAFGLQVLSSRQSFNSTRYSNILRKYFGTPFIPYPLAKALVPTARPLLDILNVKYLILLSPTPPELQMVTGAGLSLTHQDRQFQIYQNKTVWDRAYLASRVRVCPNADGCLNALANLQPGEVAVEQPPGESIVSGTQPGSVEVSAYDFDTIRLRVHALRPALLVLDENYSPGWRADIHGRPISIQRANYAFQSVAVPQGDSEVRFRYVPEGLYAGLGVTSLGFVLVAAMLFAPLWNARKQRAPRS